MRKLLKLLIIAIVMFGTCSCVKVTKENYMKHKVGMWFTFTEHCDDDRGHRYSIDMDRDVDGDWHWENILSIYSATDGTYTIKEDPAYSDESYPRIDVHDLIIRFMPDDGKLEEGMVFRVEDQNLEMTAIYTTLSKREYNLTATVGKLMIDRIYDDNSVQGRFEFSEDDLWEFSEGVFLLKIKSEK